MRCPALRMAGALLMWAALILPADADTNRVGVVTASFSMTSSGSGNWHWDHIANPDGTYSGFDGNDSLQLSISGQVSYEVLMPAGGNLFTGNLLSSTGQESASGTYQNTDWGEDASPPESESYIPDPSFVPTDMCSIVASNNPSTQQSGTGLFIGTCGAVSYGFIDGGVFYSDTDSFPPDFPWPPSSLLWQDGQACTMRGEWEVYQFLFMLNPAAGTPWTQTLTTNVTVSFSESDPYGLGDGDSGSATASMTVTLKYVADQPTLEYTATPTSGAVPLTVKFVVPNNDSTGVTVENRLIDYGDGTTEQEAWGGIFLHEYTYPGDYAISLVCSNSHDQLIEVTGPTTIHVVQPTIEFTASPTNGAAPLTVLFTCPDTDSGGAQVKEWDWDFGDGTASDEQNPSHTYTNANDFEVSLSVVNNNNYTIDATGPTTISVESPTVQFTASPLEGVVPMTVQFVCPAFDSSGIAISEYAWTFGDGGKGSNQNPLYIYTRPGIYDPDLDATNAYGDDVDSSGPPITVARYLGLVLNGDFETGDFFGWTNGGMMNESAVNTLNANSGIYGAQLEGMFGMLSTLSQTLATTPGTVYLLSFWLNNPPGNSANQFLVSWGGNTVWGVTNLAVTGWTNIQLVVTAATTNTVLQFGFEPLSFFGLDDVDVESAFVQVTASVTAGVAPLQVSFTSPAKDNNNKSIVAWEWDFGDGTGSAAQNPSHTYLTGGRYVPRLMATNSAGGTVLGEGPAITVTTPTVQFSASASVGVAPLTVYFTCPGTDSSGNSINGWNWNFGDGATGATQNPAHTYTGIGQFFPALTVTNNEGVVMAASGPAITVLKSTGLVFNGGFETGDFKGWTGSGNFDCFVSTYFVHSGHWSAELVASGSLGYLSQTLATTAGASYVLSLWLDSPDGETPNEFSVSWNGTTLFDQTNLPALGWTNLQFAVSATAASTLLQFGFRDDNSYLALDDISVILPTVQFTAAPTNGQPPLTVYFVCPPLDSGSNAITSWSWDFGDGFTSSAQNPVHTYANGGNFMPACMVTNSAGLGIAATGPAIFVKAPPTVQFSASPLEGAVPLPVQFSCPALDSGSNAITSWSWDFGDGFTSSAQNPLHTYANPGKYSPGLVATNSNNAMVGGSGATITVASRSGLVTNGDFETGDFFGWTLGGLMNYSGVTSYAPLVHSGAYGAALFGSYGPPGDSNYISQSLNTAPGTTCLLSFWLDSPNSYEPGEFSVLWGGTTVFDQMIGAITWTNVQLNLAATTPGTVLQFVFTSVSAFGLDDVSVVAEAPSQPGITSIAFSPTVSGVNLILTGTNGQSGATCCVLMTTNLAKPLSQWTPVATNVLATGGNFTLTVTNAIDPGAPQRFYILHVR